MNIETVAEFYRDTLLFGVLSELTYKSIDSTSILEAISGDDAGKKSLQEAWITELSLAKTSEASQEKVHHSTTEDSWAKNISANKIV